MPWPPAPVCLCWDESCPPPSPTSIAGPAGVPEKGGLAQALHAGSLGAALAERCQDVRSLERQERGRGRSCTWGGSARRETIPACDAGSAGLITAPHPQHTHCVNHSLGRPKEKATLPGSEPSVAFAPLWSLRRFETVAPCPALCWAEAPGDKTVCARPRGAPTLVWRLREPSGCGCSLLNHSPAFWPGQRVKGGAGILFPWVCLLPGPLVTV